MGFYRRIKYFLVHTLQLSNKAAQQLIDSGEVQINGISISENCFLDAHAEIKVNGDIVRPKTELVYLKFYKPRGFESTLNPKIPDNLLPFFSGFSNLAIAGRLDKDSEGLMLLSNDGQWVEQLCNPRFEKEKEYIVRLDKDPDALFTESFSNGVNIGNYTTQPCQCRRMGEALIQVILTEGKNRQIRRMSKALGCTVTELKRIRVGSVLLEDLHPGEFHVIKI